MEGESLCPVPDVQGQSHWGACGPPWLAAFRPCTPSACYSPHALESGSKQAPKIAQAAEDTHLLPHPSAEPAPTQLRGAEVGEGEGRNGNMPVALGVILCPTRPAQRVFCQGQEDRAASCHMRSGLLCTNISALEHGLFIPQGRVHWGDPGHLALDGWQGRPP